VDMTGVANVDDWLERLREGSAFQQQVSQILSSVRLKAGGRNAFYFQPMQSQNDVGGNPWSLQLADPWWQTTDDAYHHSFVNGHQAHIDADGKVRMVIAARDPGVPNWLDTVDNLTGVALWRWYLAERYPTPSVRVVPFSAVRAGPVRRSLRRTIAGVSSNSVRPPCDGVLAFDSRGDCGCKTRMGWPVKMRPASEVEWLAVRSP
jgi:hypothetical protein